MLPSTPPVFDEHITRSPWLEGQRTGAFFQREISRYFSNGSTLCLSGHSGSKPWEIEKKLRLSLVAGLLAAAVFKQTWTDEFVLGVYVVVEDVEESREFYKSRSGQNLTSTTAISRVSRSSAYKHTLKIGNKVVPCVGSAISTKNFKELKG